MNDNYYAKVQLELEPELTLEELKNLIRTVSFLQIGRIYNVSDNAVRKWCDSYGLPRRSSEIKSYSDEEWENI